MFTQLFQQPLRDNSIPAVWKQVHVTPILYIYKRVTDQTPRIITLSH